MIQDGDRFKGRSRASYWTLLKNDVHLRNMCKAFVKHHDLSLRKISKEISVYPYQLSNYLNNKGGTRLSDLQIMRLADFLGLKIKILVELKDE